MAFDPVALLAWDAGRSSARGWLGHAVVDIYSSLVVSLAPGHPVVVNQGQDQTIIDRMVCLGLR